MSDLAAHRKRKASGPPSGFILSAPAPTPFSGKRFKKSKSFKSFHGLSVEGVSGAPCESDRDGDGDVASIVTPNSEMFASYVKTSNHPMRSAAVSEDGSICSSRRNSETGSSLDLRSLTSANSVSSSQRSLRPSCVSTSTTPLVSAPPSLPASPQAQASLVKPSWGWFINMDIPSLTSNLELKPKRVVSSSSLSSAPLAFVKEPPLLAAYQRHPYPTVGEDKSLTWAKAADVVDELFGGLDMPEF